MKIKLQEDEYMMITNEDERHRTFGILIFKRPSGQRDALEMRDVDFTDVVQMLADNELFGGKRLTQEERSKIHEDIITYMRANGNRCMFYYNMVVCDPNCEKNSKPKTFATVDEFVAEAVKFSEGLSKQQ